MNTDEDIQAAINNAGDIGVPFVPDITESEYRSMLISIDALMNRDPEPTTPEGIQLAALVRIVEQYESKHYPIGPIEHLMSANAMQKTVSGYEPAGPCEVYSVAL